MRPFHHEENPRRIKNEEQAIQEAYRELSREDPLTARERAEQMVADHPDKAEGWVLLAMLSAPRAGVNYMRQAVQVEPENQYARAGLRWAIQRLRGQPVGALGLGQPAVRDLSALSRPKERSKILNRHVFLFTGIFVLVGGAVLVALWNMPEEQRPSFQKISYAIQSALPTVLPPAIYAPATAIPATLAPTPSPDAMITIAAQLRARMPVSLAPTGAKSVIVSLTDQRMFAYQGDVMVFSFRVSTGRNGGTAPGMYQILDKLKTTHSRLWDFEMPYWLGLYFPSPENENGFHAWPILRNGDLLWSDSLGSPVTYGCVVLGTDDARSLYGWAEIGTPVLITD
jgi:hypothetical protein